MPIQRQKYHKFDPDIDYVEPKPPSLRPINPGAGPDAVYCCNCTEGPETLCAIEQGTGEAISTTTAQMFAFWYS